MTIDPKLSTSARLLTALKKKYVNLTRFPKGHARSLIYAPFGGVIRGITIEGSKFKNLWRMRVFAFLPVERVDFIVLSQIGVVDNKYWSSEKGAWEDGKPYEGLGGEDMNYFESVCGVFEKFYMPWLEVRFTPDDLFSCTDVPVASDVFIPPRWSLRQINQYLLLCIKCSELKTGRFFYTQARDYLDNAPEDENLLLAKERFEATLEEYKAVLDSSKKSRRAWIYEREKYTLDALGLTPVFLPSSA